MAMFLGCLLLPVRFMHSCSAVQGMSRWSRLGANAGCFGLRNEEVGIPVAPDGDHGRNPHLKSKGCTESKRINGATELVAEDMS
ncbi:hypothetical protein V8C42DRAFT_313596 [Trichoderma barbatum]